MVQRGESPDGEGSASPESRLRLSIGRRPRDLLRVLVAGALLTLSVLLALVPANPVELAILRQLQRIPAVPGPFWVALSWCGSWVAIAVVAAVALYFKKIRAGLLCGAAGAVTWGLAEVIQSVLGPRPVSAVPAPPPGSVPFPATEVAVVVALTVVTGPYLGSVARRIGGVLSVLVVVAVLHLGLYLPLGAAGGALLGWGTGTLFHVLAGAPGRKVSERVVQRELELAGCAPESIVALRYRLFEPREFAVRTAGGDTLRVKSVRRMRRRAGLLHGFRRWNASPDAQEEPRLSTPHHETEHEAYVGLLAERSGVRTPAVVQVCDAKFAPPLLVLRHVDGRRLPDLPRSEIDDELLDAIWTQLTLLADAGIAHHDLRAKNFLVDGEDRPWLLGFTFSHAGADAAHRAQDLADALVSLASVVGVERTVSSAVRVLPAERLEAALEQLGPLNVPRRISAQAPKGRYRLAALRETLADRTGVAVPGLRSPVRPGTVIGLLLIAAGIYLLLPELSGMGRVLDALRRADWAWLAVAVLTGLLATLMSSISMLGSSPNALPFWRTLAVQVAAGFTGRTTPSGAGFFAINVVFMERLGFRRSLAVGVTMLNQAAVGAVAFVICVIGLFSGGLSRVVQNLRIPTSALFVALGVLVVAVGVVFGIPAVRKRIVGSAVEVARELFAVLRHPVRAALLFGGSLGYLVVSGAGLAACLAAISADFSWVSAIVVFVIGNTLGHLAPSPGGLGAVEAVLIAGLGAIGVPPTAAVTAVLTSRLLTYWLPVLPGIAMFRYLQHRHTI